MTNEIIFGERWISIENITGIADGEAVAVLNAAPEFIQKINRGAEFLARLWQEKGVIYGVTTGYGDSCNTEVPHDLVAELPLHLTRFHGCGLGDYFTVPQTRAIIAVRLTSLALGKSGVRYLLLKHLELLLQHGIYPLIPSEGSVGASGDLTPLSYLAAALLGERKVIHQGKEKNAGDVLKSLNIPALQLAPKEALAIMNGTAVMTALACEAFQRSAYLCQLAARLTAMASIALQGNFSHFNEGLFAVKPHPGQIQIAAWIRNDLGIPLINTTNAARLQDHYSLRCAPHVIGVLQDALPWFRMTIENEINSVNDNPVVDAEAEQIWHGGHFYGGHIAMVMDTMKTQVANLADLLDRQMALLTDIKFNQGLPANLSGASKDRRAIHHGFKAVQISMSAWTAEALKHTMPASVFSRSTECHNQDKVSMGTIAARDCLRVLQLTEQVFAAHLLAVTQAIQLRVEQSQLNSAHLSTPLQQFLSTILSEFELVHEDRALEESLRRFVQKIQHRKWGLYHA
jgi:histidine ammonia-lyase